MPDTSQRVLLVDDDPAIRASMALVVTHLGYRVRSAADGFSALRVIRQEMPDILITDLNMPGMSGFELLAIVWRRFPAIQKIAMSGAFSADEVPCGGAADAFYQKGSSITELLHIIRTLPPREFRAPQPSSIPAPVRIHRVGQDSSREACVTIECPECLRSFPQVSGGSSGFTRETDCIYCGNSIQYAIVDPPRHTRFRPLRRVPGATLKAEQN